MCGIAGIIDLGGNPIDPLLLVKMNEAIRHRGQDDEGYVLINQATGHVVSAAGSDSPPAIKNGYPQLAKTAGRFPATIGLAHRRFSIIDLTTGGHQPFFSADHAFCAVYNGEIYNYIEIRAELEREGYSFQTASDTEVLVEAYRAWGRDCFERLNGFWAVAIYDFARRQLVLSRDRLGKKPLYWTKKGTRVFFASEIKALLQVPEIEHTKRVNEAAIYPWLAYGKRDLGFSTFFDGIYTLPSASWAVVDESFPSNAVRFWRLSKSRLDESEISITEACCLIKETLQDAIRIRLRSDVPLAVELSGGMDSSALVALASQIHPEKVTAYTIRFPERKWNEEPFARSVARHYGVDYRVINSPLSNFWIEILPFTYLEEEPYHSPNLQTNQVIWSQMRADGFKVSLNGAAGDELFAGYSGYFRYAQLENLKMKRFKEFIDNMLHWSQDDSNLKRFKSALVFFLYTSPSVKSLIDKCRGLDHKSYIRACRSELPSADSTLSNVLHSDMTNTLMPYWLRSGDKGFMGIPFEVRAPFLDYRLVELAFRLPTSYLIRHGWHKWILRRAVMEDLPNGVLWRKKKMGFPFPYDRFYANNDAIIETILSQAQNPYLDFSKRERFKNNWNAVSFILWYELFFNENFALFHKIREIATQADRVVDYGYAPEFLNSCQVGP